LVALVAVTVMMTSWLLLGTTWSLQDAVAVVPPNRSIAAQGYREAPRTTQEPTPWW
jgi:hypothetical protein